jgi:Tfp pilus assembly protein PilZ
MMRPFTEKRMCPRFGVPGAAVSYGKLKAFGRRTEPLEKSCIVVDLSRGGIRFLTRESPSLGTKLFLELALPGNNDPVLFTGTVRWMGEHPGEKFRYSVGVQFHPYGDRKKFNPAENLDRIIDLENMYLAAEAGKEAKKE